LVDNPFGFASISDRKIPYVSAAIVSQGSRSLAALNVRCGPLVIVVGPGPGDPEAAPAIGVRSTHPDRVSLRENRMRVQQSHNDVPIEVWIETGSRPGRVRNVLVCEDADISVKLWVANDPARGRYRAAGRECACVPSKSKDCSILDWQIDLLSRSCQDIPAFSSLFEFKKGGIERFKLKGTGEGFLPRAI
jgi:hypothetical protein